MTDGRVRIVRLSGTGEGVAEDGSRHACALPGEVVGSGGTIAVAAPERAVPPCRHFGACGGCLLQHASDGFLVAWKEGLVRRALAARGLAAPFRAAHVSPPGARRRAVFAGRRTKKGAIVGFRTHRGHDIVPIAECPVARPAIAAAPAALLDIVAAGGSRAGVLRLALLASEAGLDVGVTGGKPLDGPLRARLGALAERHDLARLVWEGEAVAVRRPPFVTIGRARVVPPPGGFLQATAEAEAAMAAAVAAALAGAGGGLEGPVADLYAGAGTFALRLAEQVQVHAVEADEAALAALEAGWRGASGLRRVTVEARDLARRPLLAKELGSFAGAVIDPPRAGAEAQAEALAASGVRRVASVSCNPVSFARDAAILVRGGFALDWVQVVDQFRWSPHTEIVASFLRR